MNKLISIKAHPKLRSPILLAAWPGVGNVSMILANYLLEKLAFKDLASVEPSYFFDPIGVMAQDNVVQAPQFPQSRFYYRKGKGEERDVVLFVGDDQPSAKVYDLAGCVLDVGVRFQIDKVITCAAALTRIHFTEQPRVWGVATTEALTADLHDYDLLHRGNVQIAGLNGLLLGVAKERGISGICLLGEVAAITSRMENPMAALAILQVLTGMLHVDVDLTDLTETARETKEQIKQASALAMGEYIQHFTEPIWEQGDPQEDDEEDD
jgi:proteasome assembly chaperone (PAC2) family protein